MENAGNKRLERLYLKEWREARSWTQAQLAVRMDTTDGTISKKEAEPNKVDVEWLNRFADGLDVELFALFRHPEAATNSLDAMLAAANLSEVDKTRAIDRFLGLLEGMREDAFTVRQSARRFRLASKTTRRPEGR